MWGQKIIVIKSRSEIRYKGRLSFEINQMRGRRPERVEKIVEYEVQSKS